MATVFPNAIDSDLEIPRVDQDVSEISGDTINSLRDAVIAIESTLGTNLQGNKADLATRLNVSIDANGNIKASALALHGLVTLPIYNSQVADTAAILESKLDLDYTTAFLNSRISSAFTDINSILESLNNSLSQAIDHFTGAGNRHDGYSLDLSSEIRGTSSIEGAINLVSNAVDAHAVASPAHDAIDISINNEFDNMSASNLQDALVEMDSLQGKGLERHQDRLHASGIALNRRGEQGLYGNLKETTFASTIYQTDTSKATNILQVMRPNVARVTGNNIDFRSLSTGTNQYLRVQAGGVGRGVLDIDLSSVIPTDDIEQIIYTINYAAHGSGNHYPISAYNTGGKLTIAHTIPGYQYTIQILDTVADSAATELGFGGVLSTTFEWPGENNIAYVGGKAVKGLKQLISSHHTHSSPNSLDTITLGLGDLSLFGLTIGNEGRVLCNITNHSASSSANGTYYILSFPDSETMVLNDEIAYGTFDIEIVSDSVNFQNSTNGELFDIFLEYSEDGYGIISKSNRVSYGPISGATLRSVSESFPTSGMEWKIVDASNISLVENGEEGVSVEIPTSFVGMMQVFAPDNTNSALFEITGPPTSLSKDMTVSAFDDGDDKIYLGSVHYSGNFGIDTLKFATDRRNMGGTVENKTDDKLDPIPVENYAKELRNNGVIRGLDVLSNTETSFRIRGGKALVDGRIVDVETQDITVNDFSAASNLLLLNRDGDFVIKNDFDSGFTFEELTAGDAYGDDRGVAIICAFDTDGSIIDGYFSDRRLMVGNIDGRLNNTSASLERKITEIRNTVNGSLWGFTIVDATPDGYIAEIEPGNQYGLTYIPGQYETTTSAYGFGGGNGSITTREFQFSHPDTLATSVFRAIGLTHINIFIEIIFTGVNGGPFGASGESTIDVGFAVESGDGTISSGYAIDVRTLSNSVMPADSVTERYVASVPVGSLVSENSMFDIVPRVRINNSNWIDGGASSDSEPIIRFGKIRVVTSSYSIAGSINEEDGSAIPTSALVGNIL